MTIIVINWTCSAAAALLASLIIMLSIIIVWRLLATLAVLSTSCSTTAQSIRHKCRELQTACCCFALFEALQCSVLWLTLKPYSHTNREHYPQHTVNTQGRTQTKPHWQAHTHTHTHTHTHMAWDRIMISLRWIEWNLKLSSHWKVQEMQFKFPVQCCSRKCTLNLYISWLLKCTWNATHKFPVLKGNVPEIWHFLVTEMYRKCHS